MYRERLKSGEAGNKPPSSPYTHESAHKSKVFYSNIGDILSKGLTVPSIEQLAKAPGIRSRIESRSSKVSKEVFAGSSCDGKPKWRSVSSDTQNDSDSFEEVVVRRTSDPSSNLSSGNFDALVECHQAEEKSTGTSPIISKLSQSKPLLIQSHIDLPKRSNHFDAKHRNPPTQTPSSAQSHHHIGHPNETEFFHNSSLRHKPLMKLFPKDLQLFGRVTETSPTSLYPSSSIQQKQLSPNESSSNDIQTVIFTVILEYTIIHQIIKIHIYFDLPTQYFPTIHSNRVQQLTFLVSPSRQLFLFLIFFLSNSFNTPITKSLLQPPHSNILFFLLRHLQHHLICSKYHRKKTK